MLVRARCRAVVRWHGVRLGQPYWLVQAVFLLNAFEDAMHAVDVVGRAVQVQRDDVVVEVVRRGSGVLGQDAQDAVVVQRSVAVDVHPV